MKKSRFSTTIWLWHWSLLDRRVSSTFRRSTIGYSTVARVRRPSPANNKRRRATHRWILTESDDVTPKTNCPITFDPLETPKDIGTKRGEDLSGTQLCHLAKFHADRLHRRRDICPWTHTITENLISSNSCISVYFCIWLMFDYEFNYYDYSPLCTKLSLWQIIIIIIEIMIYIIFLLCCIFIYIYYYDYSIVIMIIFVLQLLERGTVCHLTWRKQILLKR